MSGPPPYAGHGAPVPVIPPPPPQKAARRARGGSGGSGRGIIWLVALLVGVGAGIGCYQLLPVVYESVDDWVALIAG